MKKHKRTIFMKCGRKGEKVNKKGKTIIGTILVILFVFAMADILIYWYTHKNG